MSYLLNIILERKALLPKQVEKSVNILCNKLRDGAYCPDKKNVIKLSAVSTDEVNGFLLECLNEYDKTPREYTEHHDIHSLRGVWAVLAFSRKENVVNYFNRLIQTYINGKPFFLDFLFNLFNYQDIQHPLAEKIKTYYDDISCELPSYRLINKLGIEPPEKYSWSVSLTLTTDGEWLTPRDLTDTEKENRFICEIWFGNPQTLQDTYSINVQNDLSQKRKRILFRESEIFTINVDKAAIAKPDLLNLNQFITDMENYFGIVFNVEKIAYLSVSKGINRKKIEQWIKNKFL